MYLARNCLLRTIFLRLLLEIGPPFLSTHPSKGLACLPRKLSVPSFLSYSKTLNSGAATEIVPATIRSADKRCTAWATPVAVITGGGGGGGRRGVLNKVLCGEASPGGRSNPLSGFWQKKYPFPTPSFDKWYPFLITNLEFCIPFNQCKGTAFKIWINHKTRTFSRLFHSLRINLWALLGLFTYRNNRWPYTFIYFNQ